ncbi:MAG: hypothetical protein QOE93_1485, partial [Actinomycetota bacterium]|nr:hypothetical protein [Actinomycetota bacterium]
EGEIAKETINWEGSKKTQAAMPELNVTESSP